jgi:hypothetical protein
MWPTEPRAPRSWRRYPLKRSTATVGCCAPCIPLWPEDLGGKEGGHMSDQADPSEPAVFKRGEAAWKEAKEQIAKRNEQARRAARRQREEYERDQARRAAARR